MPAREIALRIGIILAIPAAMTLTWANAPAATLVADPVKPSEVAGAGDLAAVAEELVKSLEPTVASAQAFDKGKEEVEHKAYVIALVANAVTAAQGEAKWKGSAAGVRDEALALAKTGSHASASQSLQQIKELMTGGKAASAAPSELKYLDLVPLQHVMKEVNDRNRPMLRNLRAAQFNRSKEVVARDAQLMAFLGAVARADTHSAETAKKSQADFEKYCDQFVAAARALAAAAKKGDQNAANDARKAVAKACADCHVVFRPDIDE